VVHRKFITNPGKSTGRSIEINLFISQDVFLEDDRQ
jgi:hypothetical protein